MRFLHPIRFRGWNDKSGLTKKGQSVSDSPFYFAGVPSRSLEQDCRILRKSPTSPWWAFVFVKTSVYALMSFAATRRRNTSLRQPSLYAALQLKAGDPSGIFISLRVMNPRYPSGKAWRPNPTKKISNTRSSDRNRARPFDKTTNGSGELRLVQS